MKYKKSQTRIILIGAIVFIGFASLGWWWGGHIRRGKYRDLLPALYIVGVLKFNYYRPLSATELMKVYWRTGNVNQMLKSLNDPYTEFLNQSQYNQLIKETEGSFGGIGIYLAPPPGKLVIEKVIDGGPGKKAGLRAGDQIKAIDRIPVANSEDVFRMITGKAGTKVSIEILRREGHAEQSFEFIITREKIDIPTVTMKLASDPIIGEYALIRISQFAKTTPRDLARKLNQLDRRNCKGLVLDLRANPGGLLEESVQVISHFLPKGTPALHIYHRGRLVKIREVTRNITHKQLPMVVLVNRFSASAAEVVAGALKDRKRAVVVGTPTYGKDLIQDVRELPGGVALKFTVFNYFTSGKVNIHQRGVQPNQVVEDQDFKPAPESEAPISLELQKDYGQMVLKILRKQVLFTGEKLAG